MELKKITRMITVDGSYGEGGGQILRITLALSAILGVPVRIEKIRSKRDNPGIRPQHLAAIQAVATIANAKISGASVGSSTIEFIPGKVEGGEFNFNVGTAGSITLVLQTIVPLALVTKSKIYGKVIGGTEVKWSPTFDYFNKVFVKGLQKMGIHVFLELERSGYYPEGGGVVKYEIRPCSKPNGLTIVHMPENLEVEGISRCSHLPEDVAKRQADSARRALENSGVRVSKIETVVSTKPLGKGSSITLWLTNEDTLVGGDSIGERGKRAEEVGKEAANKIISCMSKKAPVDEHAADMIFPYLVFAGEESRVAIPKVSSHLETEIFIAKHFKSFEFGFSGSDPIIFYVKP